MTQKNQTRNPGWMERPVFRENQRLTPERLNRIQEHQAQRLRMLQLGLAGYGVIYGFKISTGEEHQCKTDEGKIHIGCGLALDCDGRQLYWPGGWISVEDLCGDKPACNKEEECEYTLLAHYAERHHGLDDPCGRKEDHSDWVEEGVVFTLKRCCTPDCEECPDNCCDDACNDVCDYACGHTGAADNCVREDECLENLCATPTELCDVGFSNWFYDMENGLELACVVISDITQGNKECGPVMGFSSDKPVDVCHSRSYVYRNPLLYELLQGCHRDFPIVESLSWQNWTQDGLREIPWNKFENRISAKAPDESFTINFSKPIQKVSLHPISVFLTIFIQERRTDYWEGRRVPLKVEPVPQENDDENYTSQIRLVFDEEWKDAEIEDQRSTLTDGFIVELTIRGAMLRDECGNMLDAVPIGYAGKNYRQEMLGDDFVAAFRVGPEKEDTKRQSASSPEQVEQAY